MERTDGLRGIGIPFYSELEWLKAKTVMADGHTFHATYAEFTAKVQQAESQLRRQGTPTIRVYLRVDEFVDWCRVNGREVDAQARMEYAAIKAAEQDGG